MKFGYKQLGKPTPESINNWFDGGAFVCGLLATAINDPKATFIGPEMASVFSWILGLLIAFFLGGKRFFGVRVSAGEKVPAEDVTVMEDK
jgi:hypothetical protein